MLAERHLSPLALDFLWEACDVGPMPYPFEVRSHGATMRERAALRRRVHDQLRADQLLDDAGRVAPELADWFGVLATAELSIDSMFLPDPPESPESSGRPVLAMAAVSGGTAILATQSDQGLLLRRIPQDGLVSAIVGMLPDARRGTELSISVPATEIVAMAPGRTPAADGDRESDQETRKALARLLAMRNVRGGQIGVNSRSSMRGRRRAPVLAWFDNETGRYLSQSSVSSDGRDWVTVAPADAAALRHRIGEMASAVTAG